MVSVHPELTFERLRYSFGGDRPSQTAHLTMSPDLLQSRRLEFQYCKSGIPRTTPPDLTTWLSYSAMLLAEQQIHQWPVRLGPLVLESTLLNLLTPTADRDRTVSRRSEPSSRTALMGEQPNPWNVLPLQDAMSRHRGAKPPRRCELLGEISLLSPG